jgi:hypothetical protein
MHSINQSIHTDSLLNVKYELHRIGAADLSIMLKDTFSDKKIDYNKFNSATSKENSSGTKTEKELALNPPKEIYEYQNFFVIRELDGKLNLLDGFRRLLWYKAPDVPVSVRVYNRKDVTDQQILTLMVYLNHFKFYANHNNYLDRGFALLLKSMFDVDTTKYSRAYTAYLDGDYSDDSRWSTDGKEVENSRVKERIINPLFISDMRFLEGLQKLGYLFSSNIGALLSHIRSNSAIEYFADTFIAQVKLNPAMAGLMDKVKNANRYSDKQYAGKKILEIYENIFACLNGGTMRKSYAEKMKECKDIVAELNKDKSLTKMSSNRHYYYLNPFLEKLYKDGRKLEFKCVVYPSEHEGKQNSEYGLMADNQVKFAGKVISDANRNDGAIIKILIDGKVYTAARENLGERRYFRAAREKFEDRGDWFKIELYVNIPKKEFKEAVKYR